MGYVALLYTDADNKIFIGYNCRNDNKKRTYSENIKRAEDPHAKGNRSACSQWIREHNYNIEYKILEHTDDRDRKYYHMNEYKQKGFIILNSQQTPSKPRLKYNKEQVINEYIESRKSFY